MLISPRGKKRFRVAVQAERHAAFAGSRAKSVIAIDLADAVNGRQFQTCFSGIGEKLQWPRADDRVVRNILRRFEIALEPCVIEKLDRADVRESFAAGRITDKFAV